MAQPGLSAFLTGPSSLDSLELNSHSSTSSSGIGSRINSEYGITGSGSLGSRNPPLSAGSGPAAASAYIGSTGGSGGVGGGAGGGGQASAHTAGSALSSGNGSGLVASSEIHPLHFNWVFWFMHRPPGSKIVNYESAMKKIATFGSVSYISFVLLSISLQIAKMAKIDELMMMWHIGGGLLGCILASPSATRAAECERLPYVQTGSPACMGGWGQHQWRQVDRATQEGIGQSVLGELGRYFGVLLILLRARAMVIPASMASSNIITDPPSPAITFLRVDHGCHRRPV